MSEAELSALERMIAADPTLGELIVGSGGYRVVTFFAHDAMPVYLVAMLAKGRRENFDAREVAAMAAIAKRILSGHGGRTP